MTNIFKLKYESKEAGISDLTEKEIIINETSIWEYPPVHSVVDLGLSVVEKGTYDELGNELTPIIYKVWDFGTNEIHPVTPSHSFAGYETPTEIT